MTEGLASARDIADRITERREAADDPYLGQLGDGPFAALSHVARYQHVPADVLRADVLDGLALARALRAQLDRYEEALFGAAEKAGVSLAEAAVALALPGKRDRSAGYAYRKALRVRVRKHDQAADETAREEAERSAAAARRPDPTAQIRDLAAALAKLTLEQAHDLEDDVADIQGDLDRWRPGRPCPPELVDDVRLLLFDLRQRELVGDLAEVVDRGARLLLLPQ